MYAKEYFEKRFVSDNFGHTLCGVNKPTIVMTDDYFPAWSFHTIQIPPKFCNFSDKTLLFIFILTHVPDMENPAAECLSRLCIDLQKRSHPKLTNNITIYPNDIDLAAIAPKKDVDEADWEPDE